MKYFLCLFILFFTFYFSEAQYKVVFKLDTYPPQHNNDTIYVAGSFNAWDPRNSLFSFSNTTENNFTVTLPAGKYEYKSTRGDWKKVECFNTGQDVENHFFEINSDTTISIDIEAWKDDFPQTVKQHTASKQVQIMDTAFFIPQLNRTRRIWIYLPDGYAKNSKKYPVLYMQDGQNLFDDYTSAFGEWGVDESLDSLIRTGKPACIVVGIESGPQRLNEYSPYEFKDFGKAEGDQYLDFIVETLKPFIDKKYRTLSSRENTIIAGSSMGGLIAYYAMLQYPGVFEKAGIFSPSFWIAPQIGVVTKALANRLSGKFFFYIGELEGNRYINDMQEVAEILGENSSTMIYSVIDPWSEHNEKAWRKWFAEFYTWVMADGFNLVIKVKD